MYLKVLMSVLWALSTPRWAKSPKMWRRIYKAHGRINPYMSSPCHIEMAIAEKEWTAPKPVEEVAQKKKISQKKLKKQKYMAQE